MRVLLSIALLLISMWSSAEDLQSEMKAKEVLAWHHECKSDVGKCWIEKIISFKSNSGIAQGGVAVSYDRVKQRPEFIAIIVPHDVPMDSEVAIRFVDSVQRDGKWTLAPVGENFIGLPLSGCDETFCQARVHAQIPHGPNLFEEMKVRRFLWVMFKRSGDQERIMVPLPGMNEELGKVTVKSSD